MHYEKLSKLFKTDIKYIVKGSSLMAGSQAITSLIAFGSAVAFANFLSKDAYGTYQYIISVAELITFFSLTGLSFSVVRSVAKGYDGALIYAFKHSLRWSIFSIVIGLGIATYYFIEGNLILAIGIMISSLINPLINSSRLSFGYLNGKKLFTKSSIYTVIAYLIPVLAILTTLFFTKNVVHLILAYFLSHSAINLFLFNLVRRTTKNSFVEKETLSFAKHLSLQNVITNLAGQLDKILLFQFTGAVALAEYLFAISVPRQFQHFFKGAKTIVLPKVSERPFAELQKTLPRKVLLLYLFIIPITVTYILLAPLIFSIFFPLYQESVIFSQLYSLLFLLMPINIFNDVFIGHVKKAVLYKINILNSIIKICLTAILVPLYGIAGVIISLLATQVLNAVQIVYHYFRET